MQTIQVFWREKFNGRPVAINVSDFDPAIHRLKADGPWGQGVGLQQLGEASVSASEEGASAQTQKSKVRPRKTEE